MAQRYMINSPILVAVQRGAKTVLTLPGASVIETSKPIDVLQGLVEVNYRGEPVLMFAEDLRLRAKPVTGGSQPKVYSTSRLKRITKTSAASSGVAASNAPARME